jgi:hypothetical protein
MASANVSIEASPSIRGWAQSMPAAIRCRDARRRYQQGRCRWSGATAAPRPGGGTLAKLRDSTQLVLILHIPAEIASGIEDFGSVLALAHYLSDQTASS